MGGKVTAWSSSDGDCSVMPADGSSGNTSQGRRDSKTASGNPVTGRRASSVVLQSAVDVRNSLGRLCTPPYPRTPLSSVTPQFLRGIVFASWGKLAPFDLGAFVGWHFQQNGTPGQRRGSISKVVPVRVVHVQPGQPQSPVESAATSELARESLLPTASGEGVIGPRSCSAQASNGAASSQERRSSLSAHQTP